MAPGLEISGCAQSEKAIALSDIWTWPLDHNATGQHILFQAGYRTYMGEEYWIGPKELPRRTMPPNPKLQEPILIWYLGANTSSGLGTMFYKQCWLQTALIKHSISTDHHGRVNGTSTMTFARFTNDAPVEEGYEQGGNASTVITAALQHLDTELISNLTFIIDRDNSPTLIPGDEGGLGMFSLNEKSAYNSSFQDPMTRVKEMLNDIFFPASIIIGSPGYHELDLFAVVPPETTVNHSITGYRADADSVVYEIRFTWYVIAACIQGFAIMVTAFLYWGWWQLGRRVSFSPIEIAKAFDAPLLRDANTNAGAKGFV